MVLGCNVKLGRVLVERWMSNDTALSDEWAGREISRKEASRALRGVRPKLSKRSRAELASQRSTAVDERISEGRRMITSLRQENDKESGSVVVETVISLDKVQEGQVQIERTGGERTRPRLRGKRAIGARRVYQPVK